MTLRRLPAKLGESLGEMKRMLPGPATHLEHVGP